MLEGRQNSGFGFFPLRKRKGRASGSSSVILLWESFYVNMSLNDTGVMLFFPLRLSFCILWWSVSSMSRTSVFFMVWIVVN